MAVLQLDQGEDPHDQAVDGPAGEDHEQEGNDAQPVKAAFSRLYGHVLTEVGRVEEPDGFLLRRLQEEEKLRRVQCDQDQQDDGDPDDADGAFALLFLGFGSVAAHGDVLSRHDA